MREPARGRGGGRRRGVTRGTSLPAPTGGWDASSPLSKMKPDRAIVLDNWIPREGYVEMRRGFASHGTGLGSGVVDTLMVYHGVTAAGSKLFGCANNTIYDCSSSGAASSAVTSLNSNRWQWTNFTTSGGKFLWCCNGADSARHYNGTAWATPSLTITTYSSSEIINVHAHKNRLWFVFKDSTVAGYLPTGSVAGTVTNFELGGLFTKGGFLVAMATWTRDGGAGSDDLAVFISSEGQCALYQGDDPDDAQTWNLVGVFDLGPPIGYRCFTRVGADLALINVDGVLPLSEALSVDRNAASSVSMTRNIADAMNRAARSYKANFGWQLVPYPRGTYVVLNVPISAGATQHQYVMNTLNGAWCRFTGQNANCWAVFKDELYFGGNAGVVYKADTGGQDGDAAVEAIGQSAYNYLSRPGLNKEAKLIQPLITTDSDSRPALGISTDFKDSASLGTPAGAATASAVYDDAVWDTDVYAIEERSVSDWSSVYGIGNAHSVHFRAQSHADDNATMLLNGFNLIYEEAAQLF
jgi:hypothetical protein